MVDLPPSILRPLFDAKLRRGAVIRLKEYPLRLGPAPKYFIALNVDCSQPYIYHALTTSNVDRYQKLAFADDGVFIPQGKVSALSLPTIVDCHQLYFPLQRTRLFEYFCAKTLEINDPLPPDLMREIDAILRRNRHIAQAVKAIILPG